MNLRRKEIEEREAAGRLMEHLNATRGTDYLIQAANPPEPADVRLVSISGRFPFLDVQVVRCPIEPGAIQNQHGNTDRLKIQLTEKLIGAGLVDVVVWIYAQEGEIYSRPLSPPLVDQLATLILARRPAPGIYHNDEIDEHAIYEASSDLSETIHSVILCFHSGHDAPVVDVRLSSWEPGGDEMIQEAIAHKRLDKRYSPEAKQSVVLLLNGQWIIDQGNVGAYQERLRPGETDFKEIWIVGRFVKPTQLAGASQK